LNNTNPLVIFVRHLQGFAGNVFLKDDD